jgi:hypothetical protein
VTRSIRCVSQRTPDRSFSILLREIRLIREIDQKHLLEPISRINRIVLGIVVSPVDWPNTPLFGQKFPFDSTTRAVRSLDSLVSGTCKNLRELPKFVVDDLLLFLLGRVGFILPAWPEENLVDKVGSRARLGELVWTIDTGRRLESGTQLKTTASILCVRQSAGSPRGIGPGKTTKTLAHSTNP